MDAPLTFGIDEARKGKQKEKKTKWKRIKKEK
jgi:hypothetical protein